MAKTKPATFKDKMIWTLVSPVFPSMFEPRTQTDSQVLIASLIEKTNVPLNDLLSALEAVQAEYLTGLN